MKPEEANEKSKRPNCTYSIYGCLAPEGCARCGFDRTEAERRKHIPLTRNPYLLLRKAVGRRQQSC